MGDSQEDAPAARCAKTNVGHMKLAFGTVLTYVIAARSVTELDGKVLQKIYFCSRCHVSCAQWDAQGLGISSGSLGLPARDAKSALEHGLCGTGSVAPSLHSSASENDLKHKLSETSDGGMKSLKEALTCATGATAMVSVS